MSEGLVCQGYARARAVCRTHAKSFYWASFALFGARRRAAFAIYAFCRRLDDLVDTSARIDLDRSLAEARRVIAALHEPQGAPTGLESDWLHPAELAALRDTVARFHIPLLPFFELVAGMEMDLAGARYRNQSDLELYCYRVAGVVGLMLFPVLGGASPAALEQADALGRAMQRTNILRDVKEDLGRGRLYLPAELLQAHGLTRADLERGVTDGRWAALMQSEIARAREGYARALPGVAALTAFGARTTVRLMAALYAAILDAIEARGFDVFRQRVAVPWQRKLVITARVLLGGGAA